MKHVLAVALLAATVAGCAPPAAISALVAPKLEDYFLKLVEINFAPGFDLEVWPRLPGESVREHESRIATQFTEKVAARVEGRFAGKKPGYMLVVFQQVKISVEAEGNSGVVTGIFEGTVHVFDIENDRKIASLPVSIKRRRHHLLADSLLSETGAPAVGLMNDTLDDLLAAFANRVHERL